MYTGHHIFTQLMDHVPWHIFRQCVARRCAGEDGATAGASGHRHGSRTRTLIGTFGKTEIAVLRARLATTDGRTTEWQSRCCAAISGARKWPTR
jgi:hypothetical protein